MGHRIILDTDPGIDDALAFLLIAGSPEISLEAITVTHGNTTMAKCLANALRLADLSGFGDIPIAAGAEEPINKTLSVAEETHGDGGLGYATLPDSTRSVDPRRAHDLIIELVEKNPGEITILGIGPLTNVALALLKAPSIAPQIKNIVLMGGAIHYPGNTTPQSEYNVFCDPEAYDIVLRSGINITLVPLDVTYKTIFTTDHIKQLTTARKDVVEFIDDSTRFYIEFHEEYQAIKGCAINDPLAAAIIVKPELVTLREYYVEVELRSASSKAKTMADHFGMGKKMPNCHVAMEVDVEAFMDFFIERVNRLQ